MSQVIYGSKYNKNQQISKRVAEEEVNKVISLYKYIRDITALRQKIVLDIRDYRWSCSFLQIPKDEENIKVFYRDGMSEEKTGAGKKLLLVHKPEFTPCPEPDDSIREWLLDGWDAFENGITCYQAVRKNLDTGEIVEKIEEMEEPEEMEEESGLITLDELLGEREEEEKEGDKEAGKDILKNTEKSEVIEFFLEDGSRINSYVTWIRKREEWVKRQMIVNETRKFFTKLYQLHIELERDAESLEMIVSNGFLKDREKKEINHPVLTRRVKTVFYSKDNTICIEDTDVESEFYTMVFQEMDGINEEAVSSCIDELRENDYHPLDWENASEFLEGFAHQLSPESFFSREGEEKNWEKDNRFLLYWNPTFIVRKRVDGTQKVVNQIIENLEEEVGDIPSYLLDIVSGGKIEPLENQKEESIEEQLAAVGGESVDILLSKEANKEQLEIARRIELHNAVLVQGPPGTGKTHTIANLMGHFLAQGKTILVTSHTKKALNVLKDKMEKGFWGLCVSVLDDSNEDMEKSIDTITEYMSKYTAFELKEKKKALASERRQVIDDLAQIRKQIFETIQEEYREIDLNGEKISVLDAAKFVAEHREDLSYIPGDVKMYEPLPVSYIELEKLYESNEKLTNLDEKELACELPRPDRLLSPANFETLYIKKKELECQLEELELQREWKITRKEGKQLSFETEFAKFDMDLPSQENLDDLKKQMQKFGQIEEWMKYAAVDGRRGTAYKRRWETLIEQIKITCSLAEKLVSEQFGKTIWFEHEDHKEEYIPILEKIREVFERKGRVTGLDLFFNRNFNFVLEEVKINGNKIQSESDCDIILNSIELAKQREQCARYWDELLTPHRVPNFFSLDTLEPERIASKWIPEIEYYISWYEMDYSCLVQKMRAANFPVSTLFAITTLDSELEEINKILTAVKNSIPFIIKACQLGISCQRKEYEIEKARNLLQERKRINSEICQGLVEAIGEGNLLEYKKYFGQLEETYEKYSLQKEREKILSKLNLIAPGWAKAIKEREKIHGQGVIPAHIEDAWKWKQYAEILAKIIKNPFQNLQEESMRLSKKYRKVTADYAQICAWYYLLQKTECDIDMKQALQGWKQTIKKIGKGTGKNAPRLRAEARKLMAKCQEAVPAWIMPMNRALESLDPRVNRFDIIIVDEASQSDISSLAIAYMARKLIIVGDDKQVSPMGIGVELDKMNYLEQVYLNDVIPNSHLYNIKTSLYDIAATTFPSLMLREHFRCVPEIIGFSNKLSYDYKIKPLRDANSSVLLPAVINYRVKDGQRNGKIKENTKEAEHIVALLMVCMEQKEYEGKTFGVISLLGDLQAKRIQSLIFKYIDVKEIERRKLLCGNASHFQGDERDVIFLSMVDSRLEDGPLALQGYGVEEATRKRYNVATSRARDQLWVVNSLDAASDLKAGDIRKTLLDYATNPEAFSQTVEEIEKKSESPFEEAVAKSLVARGYHIRQQWEVGAYRLDIVVVYEENKIAIECDGERYHSSESQIRADMERQTILERIGWRFIRIRGSEFFSDREQTINHVCERLEEYGVYPEAVSGDGEVQSLSRETELVKRVKVRATEILDSFKAEAKIDSNILRFVLGDGLEEN